MLGESYWPLAVANQPKKDGEPDDKQSIHIITLKELDANNMLLIRDSARPDDQEDEVRLENNVTNDPNKMTLAHDECLYFTC